jgi:hypothetical protein
VRLFCGGRTTSKGVLVLGGDDSIGFGKVPQRKESFGFSKRGGPSGVERGKWLVGRDWRGCSSWVRAAISLLGMGSAAGWIEMDLGLGFLCLSLGVFKTAPFFSMC